MTKYYDLSMAQMELVGFDSDEEATADNVNTLCAVAWLPKKYTITQIEAAWNEIVQKEQGLRMRLIIQDETPKLYEEPYHYEKLTVWNLSDRNKQGLYDYFKEKAAQPIPFIKAPLFALSYFIGKTNQGIFLASHHLIMDGFSVRLIFEKLLDALKGISLPDNSQAFVKTLIEEEKSLHSPRYEQDCQYWKEQFKNWNGLARLNPSVSDGPTTGKRLEEHLSKENAHEILSFCKVKRISPACLFETILALYLQKKNPTINIISIGQNLLNRKTKEQMTMLGLFSAERMTMVSFDKNDTFDSSLKKVNLANQMAYYHGLCLHDKVLSLANSINPEITAIRDVEFSFQPFVPGRDNHIQAEWIPNFAPEVSMEFTVCNVLKEDDFLLIADYRPSALNDSQAKAFLDEFKTILNRILADSMKGIEWTKN